MLTVLTRPISLRLLQRLCVCICVCVCVCVLVLLQRERNEQTKGKGNAKDGINCRFLFFGSFFLKFEVEPFLAHSNNINKRVQSVCSMCSCPFIY